MAFDPKNHRICFSGKSRHFNREDMITELTERGANWSDGVTRKVTMLVLCGNKGKGNSGTEGKLATVEKLRGKDVSIQVVIDSVFVKMMHPEADDEDDDDDEDEDDEDSGEDGGDVEEPPSKSWPEPEYGLGEGFDLRRVLEVRALDTPSLHPGTAHSQTTSRGPQIIENECDGATFVMLEDAPSHLKEMVADVIIAPELVSAIPVKNWPVIVLSTDQSKNAEILANGCEKWAKILKALDIKNGYLGGGMSALNMGHVVRIVRALVSAGQMYRRGKSKRTSHMLGFAPHLLISTPPSLTYEEVEEAVRAEKPLYTAITNEGIGLSNDISSLGKGLNFLKHKGDEAFLYMYVCQSSDDGQQLRDYWIDSTFSGYGDDRATKVGNANAAGKHFSSYFLCDICGGWVLFAGHIKCGNPLCAATKMRSNPRYNEMQREVEMQRLSDDGDLAGLYFSSRPCYACYPEGKGKLECKRRLTVTRKAKAGILDASEFCELCQQVGTE